MKKLLSFFALSIFSLASLAQISPQSIQQNFANYLPSEKLYLHTDKPNYFLKDTIWFKGYLVWAADHEPSLTNFIQVELLDVRDTIVASRKILRDSAGTFSGYLDLDKDLPENDYTIRAYTSWMQNFDKEYFYYKNIRISSPSIADVRVKTQVRVSDSMVKLSLTLSLNSTLPNLPVECSIRNLTTNKNTKARTEKTDANGQIDLPTRGISVGDVVIVELSGAVGKHQFKNSVRVEIPSPNYEVRFLPEGGDLVAGAVRRVAFKALSTNGYPVDIRGFVLDEKQDTVAIINSHQNSGMGTFMLQADAGKSYTAHTFSTDRAEQIVRLPQPKTDGVAIRINTTKDTINYMIEKAGALQWLKMYAVVHSHGELQYIMPLERPSIRHSVPIGELKAGVSHLVVIDSMGRPLAERLFFVQPNPPTIATLADSLSYSQRSLVTLSLSLPDEVEGNFSLSVTDDQFVNTDTLADNIVSNMLLTSDLHGTIENPAQYIGSPTVDLVMLTNGWRRFDVSKVIAGEQQALPFAIEVGQVISGKIISPFKENTMQSKILAQVVAADKFRLAKIDENNRFLIDSLNVAGKKQIMLIPVNPKNRPLDAEIILDTIAPAPAPWTKLHSPIDRLAQQEAKIDQIIEATIAQQPDISQFYTIETVEVKAKNRKWENVYDVNIGTPFRLSRKFTLYYSPMNKYMTYFHPNWSVKKILETRGWVSQTVIFDGMKMDFSELANFNGDQITAIENVAVFGIVIESKRSNPQYDLITAKGMKVVNFVGYDLCEAEFYSPQYIALTPASDVLSDYRTTIYWKPNINLKGCTPQTVSFYTSDDTPSSYTVTIEGVTTNGFATKNYKLKVGASHAKE